MKRSTIRYAAKAAYRLAMMRGIYESTQCKMKCVVNSRAGYVTVCEMDEETGGVRVAYQVAIAKAWINL